MAHLATADLLTPHEVAARLRLSRASVYRYVRVGRLEAHRLHEYGPLRIRADSLDHFLSHDGHEDAA
jgi:excisionase family DNA binding protein